MMNNLYKTKPKPQSVALNYLIYLDSVRFSQQKVLFAFTPQSDNPDFISLTKPVTSSGITLAY